jgi:phosphatidylserine decarboxylase
VIQAKGRDYSVEELLGGDAERADAFTDGAFATIYLAPSDYHRIHMPLGGNLVWMRHVPGRLFSVNATTAGLVPRLFARNERVACGFTTPAGSMTMVLIGAIFVGGIETVWAGEITPIKARAQLVGSSMEDQTLHLARGAEMGRFNLGSTVVLLFEPGRIQWDEALTPGREVRLGKRLGCIQAGV